MAKTDASALSASSPSFVCRRPSANVTGGLFRGNRAQFMGMPNPSLISHVRPLLPAVPLISVQSVCLSAAHQLGCRHFACLPTVLCVCAVNLQVSILCLWRVYLMCVRACVGMASSCATNAESETAAAKRQEAYRSPNRPRRNEATQLGEPNCCVAFCQTPVAQPRDANHTHSCSSSQSAPLIRV